MPPPILVAASASEWKNALDCTVVVFFVLSW